MAKCKALTGSAVKGLNRKASIKVLNTEVLYLIIPGTKVVLQSQKSRETSQERLLTCYEPTSSLTAKLEATSPGCRMWGPSYSHESCLNDQHCRDKTEAHLGSMKPDNCNSSIIVRSIFKYPTTSSSNLCPGMQLLLLQNRTKLILFHMVLDSTSCLRKISVTHWPILIIFGTQHQEETLCKWHLTLILWLHYLVKCISHTLAVYNSKFILGSACVGSENHFETTKA